MLLTLVLSMILYSDIGLLHDCNSLPIRTGVDSLSCTGHNIVYMEQWLPAEGFEGYYEVSNYGRIKGLAYTYVMPTGHPAIRPERILVNQQGKTGYWVVMMRNRSNPNNKVKCVKIHRLIAKAFIPNPDNLPCINHIDGNSFNNEISNLEWCTHKQNIQHAFRIGLVPKVMGEKTTNAKLTEEQVLFIYNSNKCYKDLMKMFNVTSSSCIYSIKSGRTWSHLTGKAVV